MYLKIETQFIEPKQEDLTILATGCIMKSYFDYISKEIKYTTIKNSQKMLIDAQKDKTCFAYDYISEFDYITTGLTIQENLMRSLTLAGKKAIYYINFARQGDSETEDLKNCK